MNLRKIAVEILNTYFLRKNNTLSLKHIINLNLNKSDLSDLDKNLIYEIVKGTLRYLLKIDYIISIYSKISLEKIDLPVLNILRISIYQILFLTKIPHYSVLFEAVEIAKKVSGKYSSGFINAVLRKISSIKNFSEYINTNINNIKDQFKRLSIFYSFPIWIIKYWSKNYKLSEIENICSALNKGPYNYARVNKLKINKKILLNKLNGQNIKFLDPAMMDEFKDNQLLRDFKVLLLKNLIFNDKDLALIENKQLKFDFFEDAFILNSLQNLDKIDLFLEGFFSIQDLSSQISIKYLLNPKPNEKILDLCGAPGGKSIYAAELTNCKSQILSVDINSEKLNIFKKNIKRLGINNISLIKKDLTICNFLDDKYYKSSFKNYFDKIIFDPPCTAFGTSFKNPDVKYNKKYEDTLRLAKQAMIILNNSIKYLKLNGKVLFYTCTISENENQKFLNDFINQNYNRFRLLHINDKGYIEILPYYFKSEAGFIAILEKIKD